MSKNSHDISVLVVEDDLGLNKLICKSLANITGDVKGVATGQEAIEVILKNPKTLVLLDYQLSDMTGFDVINKLEISGFHPWFIMITGRGDERTAISSMKMGARDYIVKESHFLEVIPTIVMREIADIKNELKLEEVEGQFRDLSRRNSAILDTVDDIIVEVDENKKYTWSNRAGFKFFGENLIGKEAKEFFVGKQDTYDKVKPVFDGTQDMIYCESLQQRSDGEARMLGWWCKALFNENGSVIGVLSTATDITEIKKIDIQREEDLKVRTAYNEILSLILNPGSTIEGVAEDVLIKAKELVGAKEGFVGEIEQDTGDLVIHTFTRMMDGCMVDAEARTIRFSPSKKGIYNGLWGYSLNRRESFFTNSPQEHPGSCGVPTGHIEIDNFLAVPIEIGQDLVGQIALANCLTGFDEAKLAIIKGQAHFYALAVQQMRYEKELQDSEQKFRDLVEYNPIGVFDVRTSWTKMDNKLRTASV